MWPPQPGTAKIRTLATSRMMTIAVFLLLYLPTMLSAFAPPSSTNYIHLSNPHQQLQQQIVVSSLHTAKRRLQLHHARTTPNKAASKNNDIHSDRRSFTTKTIHTTAVILFTTTATTPGRVNARYILNEQTGEYDEVNDEDWQTTWSKRLDKAKSMGTEEVFLAAQGAGNLNLRAKGMEESETSKKRRALAGCRNDRLRQLSGDGGSAQECTARVLKNDYQFMVDVM